MNAKLEVMHLLLFSNSNDFNYSLMLPFLDAKGNQQLVSGSIQPMDVWNNNGSIKYVVHFNELYQPIRKGGHILVRFLGSIAKQGPRSPTC